MSASKTEDQKLISALKTLFGSDKIKDCEPLTPERREHLREMIKSVLQSLSPREEKVIRMRFGIGEKSDYTLEEIGQDFEVTRERIRQIEAKALRKMQLARRSPKL